MDKFNARKGLALGNGKAQDTEIEINNGAVNKPKVRWNETTQKWQFSNDGVTFDDFGSGGTWGDITGTLSEQTDLQSALDTKLNSADNLTDVADQQTALNNVTAVAGATDEYVLTKDTSTGNALWKEVVSSDELLKVSANDTTAGYLEDKIVGTTNKITVTPLDNSGYKDLQIGIGTDIFDKSINTVDDVADGTTYVKTENNLTDILKTNYDSAYMHSVTSGNPHGVTKTDIGLGNVVNVDISNPANIMWTESYRAVTDTEKTTWNAKVNSSDVVVTATANKILKLDANAKLPANITGNADGNSATATTLQTARTINEVSFDGSADITINAVDSTSRIASSEKGIANGVATLDNTGKVPSSQLPSYVDDVLEYANYAGFPATGEASKIYVALDVNLAYRWGGSNYVEISPSIALGETSTTAYRGDRGNIAYDHSQLTGGTNPHNTTFANIGNKPTTVAGYGITDGVTLTGTQTLTNKTISSPVITGTPTGITATHIGLGNVTNNAQVKKIASSTDNAIMRFDGTAGDLPQNSLATISDTGTVNIPTGQNYNINGVALKDVSETLTNKTLTSPNANKLNINATSSTVLDSGEILQTYINSTNGTYTFGGILANTYRDVTNPSLTAGMWFESTTVAGIISGTDVVFGSMIQGNSNSRPLEALRIKYTNSVGARPTIQAKGAFKVTKSSTTAMDVRDDSETSIFTVDTSSNTVTGTAITTTGEASKLVKTISAGNIGMAQSVDGGIGITLSNTSAGSLAYTGLNLKSDLENRASLVTYGSGRATTLFGAILANKVGLVTQGADCTGLLIGTLSPAPIIIGTNNIERLVISESGNVTSKSNFIVNTGAGDNLVLATNGGAGLISVRSATSVENIRLDGNTARFHIGNSTVTELNSTIPSDCRAVVYGSLGVRDASDNRGVWINVDSASDTRNMLNLRRNNGDTIYRVGVRSDGNALIFGDSNVERLAIHKSKYIDYVEEGINGKFFAGRLNGTYTAPTAVLAGDVVGTFGCKGQIGTTAYNYAVGGVMSFVATGNYTGLSNAPTDLVVSLTTTTIAGTETMRLTSTGNLTVSGYMGNTRGATVASATTITPTGQIFHISGTTAIATINIPYTGFNGSITIIPDGIFTTTTAGNIALESTAIVNKALIMTYDTTTAKWYPSY